MASPSFRAVEKLGIENPELDQALKTSGIMQLGYDPSILIQRGPVERYESTNLGGLYLPDTSEDTRYDLVKEEAEKRNLEEAVYVKTDKGVDRYIEAMGEDQTAELFGLQNKKELNKLNNYLKSDDFLRKTLFEEFFHRGMVKGFGEDNLSNQNQDMLISAFRLKEAPKDIKPLLEKYIKKMEGGLPSEKAYDLLDEYEAKANEMLKKRFNMDKPLYED